MPLCLPQRMSDWKEGQEREKGMERRKEVKKGVREVDDGCIRMHDTVGIARSF